MDRDPFDDKYNIVVFSGAHYGKDPKYQYIAYEMGKLIAQEGYNLVNGAGSGLMEETSKGAKEAGGKVFGVGLHGEIQNKYTDVYHDRVGIHSRQSYLFSWGDAFIGLPGGFGTLYETIEIAIFKVLNEVEQEPVILLNFEGFYDDFKNQLFKMRETGFIDQQIDQIIEFVNTPAEAIAKIKGFYKAK